MAEIILSAKAQIMEVEPENEHQDKESPQEEILLELNSSSSDSSRLEAVLSRRARTCHPGRRELVDSFKHLQQFVEQLALYLNRQELEDILRDTCVSSVSSVEPESGKTEA